MATEWYCRVRGQLRGPLSPQELKALAADGQLAPDSLVRQGTAGAWVKAVRVKGLFQSGAATDAKSKSEGATSAPGAVIAVSNLPDLGAALDDLGDLPGFASTPQKAAPPQGLPVGQTVGPALPLGELPSAVPRGTALPPGTLPGGGPLLVDPALSASGPQKSLARENKSRGGLSEARVLSVGIVAVALSFLGLCFVLYPIIPMVLGVAGVLTGLRAMLLGGRRNTLALVLAAVAALLGVGAAGGGLYNVLSGDDPIGRLNAQLGGALTGEASPATSAKDQPFTHWHQAREEVALTDDLRIQITGVAVGHLPGREPSGKSDGSSEGKVYLMVSVRLENVGNRKVDYASYSGTVGGTEFPDLRDNLGSNYGRVTTPGLPGQLRRESLYPGDAKVDLIVFERPVASYQQLELTLPGAAFGDTKPVRFQIPRSMVENDIGSSAASGAGEPAAPPRKPKVVEIRSEGEDKEPVESPPEKTDNP